MSENSETNYLIEQYWPSEEGERNLDDLYVWFHEKKLGKDSKIKAGDKFLFYEVGQHPTAKIKGAKALFASGTLSGERIQIPANEQLRGGKRWMFKRKVTTDIAVPPKDGIPLNDVRRILQKTIWPQTGFPISKDHFHSLQTELTKKNEFLNVQKPATTPKPPPSEKEYADKELGTIRASSQPFDTVQAALRLEKSSNAHRELLNKLVGHLRQKDFIVSENSQVDLFGKKSGEEWIFEIKSVHAGNMLAQIRHGISQLYEYRFRYRKASSSVRLCLVLQTAPSGTLSWVIDYLQKDRGIEVCWPVPGGFGTVKNGLIASVDFGSNDLRT